MKKFLESIKTEWNKQDPTEKILLVFAGLVTIGVILLLVV